MQRYKTVGDLIQALEELDENTPLMAVHQQSYPLVESVVNVWVDDGKDDEEEEATCISCGRLLFYEPQQVDASEVEGSDGDEKVWARRCSCGTWNECEEPNEPSEKIAYLVLDPPPYDVNPYGSKRAWSS